MKLRVLGRYVNHPRNLAFKAGDVIDLSDDIAQFVLRDAPGCFAQEHPTPVIEPETEDTEDKALDHPPRDKMMRRSYRKSN